MKIRKWNMNNLQIDRSIVILGKKGTGKSVLLGDLLKFVADRLHFGCAFCPTGPQRREFLKHMPAATVHRKFDKNILGAIIDKQKECEEKNIPMRKIYIIMDDCAADKQNFKGEMLNDLFLCGRHYNIFFVCAMQYLMSFSPEMRQNTDYVFCLKESNKDVRKKLYEYFFGMFDNYNLFEKTLFKCTQNNECIVLDNTITSNNPEDVIYFYKADKAATDKSNFQMGADLFWSMHNAVYLSQDEIKKRSEMRKLRGEPEPPPTTTNLSKKELAALEKKKKEEEKERLKKEKEDQKRKKEEEKEKLKKQEEAKMHVEKEGENGFGLGSRSASKVNFAATISTTSLKNPSFPNNTHNRPRPPAMIHPHDDERSSVCSADKYERVQIPFKPSRNLNIEMTPQEKQQFETIQRMNAQHLQKANERLGVTKNLGGGGGVNGGAHSNPNRGPQNYPNRGNFSDPMPNKPNVNTFFENLQKEPPSASAPKFFNGGVKPLPIFKSPTPPQPQTSGFFPNPSFGGGRSQTNYPSQSKLLPPSRK